MGCECSASGHNKKNGFSVLSRAGFDSSRLSFVYNPIFAGDVTTVGLNSANACKLLFLLHLHVLTTALK